MTDEQLVKAVYKERGTKFGGSTANVQASVAKRFGSEEQDIMGLLKSGGAPASAQPQNSGAPATASAQPQNSGAPATASAQPPRNSASVQPPSSPVPTTAAVQTTITPVAPVTTQTAEAARAQAAATDPRRTDRPQTAVAGARQETPESLLTSLNTKLDQLIAINRSLKDTNERQLSVQKGMAQAGDLFA
jgi:hypothetical protein